MDNRATPEIESGVEYAQVRLNRSQKKRSKILKYFSKLKLLEIWKRSKRPLTRRKGARAGPQEEVRSGEKRRNERGRERLKQILSTYLRLRHTSPPHSPTCSAQHLPPLLVPVLRRPRLHRFPFEFDCASRHGQPWRYGSTTPPPASEAAGTRAAGGRWCRGRRFRCCPTWGAQSRQTISVAGPENITRHDFGGRCRTFWVGQTCSSCMLKRNKWEANEREVATSGGMGHQKDERSRGRLRRTRATVCSTCTDNVGNFHETRSVLRSYVR